MYKEIKIAHMADIHLGRRFESIKAGRFNADIKRQEIWKSFENSLNICKDLDIQYVILAGDIYEKEYFTQTDFDRLSDIFNRYEFEFIYIAGNHDYLRYAIKHNIGSFPNNVKVLGANLDYIEYESSKLRFHGFSWDKEIVEKIDLNNIDIDRAYKNILILHADYLPNDEYLYYRADELPMEKFDYIALGHIHKPTKLSENTFYSGSLEPLSFKEDEAHGFRIFTIDEHGLKDTEFIASSIRNYHNIEINIESDESFGDIRKKFLDIKNRNKDYFRINLKGFYDSSFNIESLYESLSDYFYYIEIKDMRETQWDMSEIEKLYEDTIVKNFIDNILNDENIEEVYKDKIIKKGLEVLLTGVN
ncbi:MAG: metallophosphoesterase family protein [Tissierellia bacterium]|nr:metallophosphoesterase family protein [Tissierellia bacterium]